MKWLLVFGLIATILNAPTTLAGDSDEDSSGGSSDSDSGSSDSGSSSSSSESSSTSKTVKVTKVEVLSASTDYFSSDYTYTVKKVSSSYNAVAVNYAVIQDLPSDTKVVVKIYGSTSESNNYSSVKDCSFTLSDTTSTYHQYLPSGLLKDMESSQILRKGSYKSDDYGYFEFHKVLTQTQLTYSYYKVVVNFECDNEVIFSLDNRFQCA